VHLDNGIHACLQSAKNILLGSLAYTLTDVRLTLTDLRVPEDQGRNPLFARRTMWCPDLLSAVYLQFYLMVTDNKPLRRCENPACGLPFPAKPKHKRFCNASCRSNARNYRSR
jgi:hypothetical protein